MTDKIKYPAGIQTFPEIIEDGYLYVDKTASVYDLVHSDKYVFLSRPRRFGKSLLMSTIEAYFRGRRELFKGLAIDKLEKEWKSYPVFHFDLSGTSYQDTEELIEVIGEYLTEWEDEYGLVSSGRISIRFSRLLNHVFKTTGKKSVILIDEYDKPLLDTIDNNDLHDRNRKELSGFYSVIKKRDACIKFGMITGITKFGKVNIFSGLNNLLDISLLPEYNNICGITESEFRQVFQESVTEFAERWEMSENETWEKFKTKYDGYLFACEGENIYNPYSVLLAFRTFKMSDYWFTSGSSSHLISILKQSRMPLIELEGAKRCEGDLADIADLKSDIVPLLFQAGYLTIKKYEQADQVYTLGFPNEEVSRAFWQSLARNYFNLNYNDIQFKISQFVKEVNEGQTEEFLIRLKALIADTHPGAERKKEIHFQNVMTIIFKMLGFSARTEVVSSAGRCDLQIFTPTYVYIFEFKLDGTPEEALRQIFDRGYHRPFAVDKRTLILIGAVFSSKTNTLADWIILDAASDSLPLK